MNEIIVGQCGIIAYGVEYIKRNLDNIIRWKLMNPTIRFTIISTRLSDPIEEQDELEIHIKTERGIDMIYIENNMLAWYKAHIKEQRQLVFLSDIIRWHGIDKLKDKGNPVFLLEADTICIRPNWMEEYCLYELIPGITIFGPDRSCIVYYSTPDEVDSLADILKMFKNVFGGNFQFLMYEDDEYIQRKLLHDEHYQFLKSQTTVNPLELNRFIDEFPHSILSIGILSIEKFKFNRPYLLKEKYNAELQQNYKHLAEKLWSGHGGKIKKSGKSKRNKKTRKTKKLKLI